MAPSDRDRAIAALEAFLAEAQGDRREDAIAGLEANTEQAMRTAFARQNAELQRRMVGLRPAFADPDARAITAEALSYFGDIADMTRDQMEGGLYDNILNALWVGGGHLVDDIGVPLSISFGLDNPRAVGWAIQHAAEQVTRIDDTTRDAIRRVITGALETGQSYDKTADALASMFEFSPGRARRIAVFEMGASYEHGKILAADEITAQGLTLEKKWQSAGDSKVRPAHVANQFAGWLPKDARFPGDGASEPPTDPGCRCTLLWRMAPEGALLRGPVEKWSTPLMDELEEIDKRFQDTAMTTAEYRAERERAVENYMRRNKLPKAYARTHGMSDEVDLNGFRFGGVDIYYESGLKRQARDSVLRMAEPAATADGIPRTLADSTRRVIFTKQDNSQDAMWQERYNMSSFRSAATGGDGTIVVYSGRTIGPATFAHEAGHNLATRIYGSTRPPPDSLFAALMGSDEAPVNDYGSVAPAEDFATAIEYFVSRPRWMEANRPGRYELIRHILLGGRG